MLINSDDMMEDKGLPDFNGKIVIVYLKQAPEGCAEGILIEYPNFVKRNGRVFLAGRIPEIDGQEWVSGSQTAVLWDAVIHYLEFKSLDDYRNRLIDYRPSFIDRLRALFM